MNGKPSPKRSLQKTLYFLAFLCLFFMISDIFFYRLGQSTTVSSALIGAMLYLYFSILQIPIIPISLIYFIVLWIHRLLKEKTDPHTWISLGLILPTIVWAIAKLIFWIGEL